MAAVILVHAGVPGVQGGFIGVDVFFVLSGFLITALLLADLDENGTIRLGRFWARRALRIFPPLAVLVLASSAWVIVDPGNRLVPGTRQGLPWVGLFLGNWAAALDWSNLGVLAHTWSVAAEVQCYLVWAGVLVALRWVGTRHFLAFAIAVSGSGAVAVLLWRALTWNPVDTRRAYFGLDTRADAFLVGAFVALVVAAGLEPRTRRGRGLQRLAGVLGAIGLVVAIPAVTWRSPYMYRWGGFTLVAAAAGLVLLSLVGPSPGMLSAALRCRPLVALGRISYGLYLWHFPVVVLVPPGWKGLPAGVTIAFELAVSLALAVSSRLLVERPLARLKEGVGAWAVAAGPASPAPRSTAPRPA